ncbi:MAG: CtsR family transcriptional regulator [Clostridia bacterium]|nr:CtsR family transcriptional regulator [Clostridia bacterium]
MLISDAIAKLIEEMINEGEGAAEIKRNDLAGQLGCVPSQINYVITSRFTPERGYIIESRRGGGGYIRIIRKQMGKDEYLMHFLYAIGDSIDEKESVAFLGNLLDQEVISEREYVLLGSTISNTALSKLPSPIRNSVRADILRHIILRLMK